MIPRNLYWLFLFIAVPITLIAAYIYIQMPKDFCQQFAWQSQSFLQGRLDVPQTTDTVFNQGKYYWPQGPFPSILLMPVQLIFGPGFNQSILQPFLVILLFIFLFKLALLKKFPKIPALILAYAFIFASPVLGIVTEPCYSFFAHLITITLLTATLLEFEGKQRPLILGLFIGMIIATRPTGGFILLAVLGLVLFQTTTLKQKFSYLIKLFLPIGCSIGLLLLFNYVRFQNPFDNGYNTNDVGQYLESLRSVGVFNPNYIPRNISAYFLSLPVFVYSEQQKLIPPFITYNSVGTSLFIIAPFFLYSIKTFQQMNLRIMLYWGVIWLTLIILLSYYATGWVQFGPRFTTDFLPILFLLTLYGLSSQLKWSHLLLIILSSLVNIYLLSSGFILFKS